MANKQYREEIVNITLRKKFPTFKRQDKKIDFVVPELGLSCGETKTAKCSIKDGKISNCKFEFDKQNDPARQENTLKSDAFVFAGINSDNPSDSEILFYIFVHNKEEVSSVIKLLRTKQEDFNIVLEQIKKENKQLPRDTIQVELKDLIELGLPVYDANHNKIIN